MCVFSVKILFVKTLTRVVKYESQVIKSNPVVEYSTYGTYGGATFQLGNLAIWILVVRVIKTQNLSLEES